MAHQNCLIRIIGCLLFVGSPQAQADDPKVVAWVSFGRSGSTMFRHLLHERIRRRGWKMHASGKHGICKAKPLNFSNLDAVVPCEGVEHGAVVQTEYHYCDLKSDPRQCRYITILREPIAQMISQFNSFCLDCEKSSECTNSTAKERPAGLTCPNMPIVEYTRYHRNQIMIQFSGKKPFCSRTGEPHHSALFRECVQSFSPIDFKVADKALKAENMMALRLESLWDEQSREPRGMSLLGNMLEEPKMAKQRRVQRNKGHRSNRYQPTDAELQEMKHLLALDIQLYNAVAAREPKDWGVKA